MGTLQVIATYDHDVDVFYTRSLLLLDPHFTCSIPLAGDM